MALHGIGGDETRRDAVDVDVVPRPHEGEIVGQADHPGLRGGVVQHERIALRARSGGDVDDVAALLLDHLLAGGDAADERAGQVEVDQANPILVGRFLRLAHPRTPAGIVHHDVEPTELRDGPRDQRVDLFRHGDVGRDRQCAAAVARDPVDNGVDALLIAARHHHGGTRTGVFERDVRAYAAGPASDNGDLVLKFIVGHAFPWGG